MTERGRPRRAYSRAIPRSSSWVLYRSLHCQNPHCELRHHRDRAGDRRIAFFDQRGRLADRHPIVKLRGNLCDKLSHVHPECGAAYRGIVPEKPVPFAGEQERHAGLRVAVRELQSAALQVQTTVLVLPHAVDFLIVAGFETCGHLVCASGKWPELTPSHFRCIVPRPTRPTTPPPLLQHDLASRVGECDAASVADCRGDLAIRNHALVPGPSYHGVSFRCRQQSPIPALIDFWMARGAHAKTALSPGLYPYDLRVERAHKHARVRPYRHVVPPGRVYPLTAPLVNPPMTYFCRNVKMMMTGSTRITP